MNEQGLSIKKLLSYFHETNARK